ncbi:MAG: hypothetical protein Q8M88_10190 [Phenylobacterium sp.]|uniref:anti-sigma factor family protein n=1 Tax=Phenylobacterium sp. TaxID=1871053 RepID=UPI0027338E15|nr:hypothetical protein [Phenylobacterium sp.]MDP3174791.1 hypothetical protein [Phenylobacterium sp.]
MTTDARVIAYVDGELDLAARRALEAEIAADATLALNIERHRSLREAALRAFAGVLDEPVPAHLIAAASRPPVRRSYAPPRWAAMAASLVLGVVGGGLLTHYAAPSQGGLVASGADGALMVRGPLAKALSEQAAAESDGRPISVGLSFRTADGRYCRTFAAPAQHLAGLGCREGAHWAAPVAVAYEPATTQFRMASSETPPAVLAAVNAMIQGEPFGPDEESAAIAHGWRD